MVKICLLTARKRRTSGFKTLMMKTIYKHSGNIHSGNMMKLDEKLMKYEKTWNIDSMMNIDKNDNMWWNPYWNNDKMIKIDETKWNMMQ